MVVLQTGFGQNPSEARYERDEILNLLFYDGTKFYVFHALDRLWTKASEARYERDEILNLLFYDGTKVPVQGCFSK